MFDRILFPTDGSDGADAVLAHALDLAHASEAELHVLHVADTTEYSLVRIEEEVVDVQAQAGVDVVDAAVERAEARGIEAVGQVVRGQPYRSILAYADEHGVDLLVMPTHSRRDLGEVVLGSTTDRVVRRADVPVLTVRPEIADEVAYPYRSILVPTDGSDGATLALERALDLAVADDARLHLLSVVETDLLDAIPGLGPDGPLEERARSAVDRARSRAGDAGVEVRATVEEGASVSRTIATYAEANGVDLVVMGTHGRSGLDRYLIGSVAERLLRITPAPVMTVRPPDEGSSR
ncbi:MAG: universal stress protein [Halobacteriales archaeon]